MIIAVRGATTVDVDKEDEIISRVNELVDKIYSDNDLKNRKVISVHFTITDDLVSINPAAALRRGGGYADVPLFCSQEPKSNNALERAIRILVTWNGEGEESVPSYLHGAKVLRPDLVS